MLKHVVALAATVAFLAGTASASADALFTDGAFNPASYSAGFTFKADPANTIGYSICAACGDPGAALAFSITEPNGGGAGFSNAVGIGVVNSAFTYDPAAQGAIASIAASADKDFTVSAGAFNNGFRPLIEQDGKFYGAAAFGPTLTGPGTTGYVNIAVAGLTAADFTQFDPATGAFTGPHPDFAGDAITFGVAQLLGSANIPGLTVTTDYDNLRIAVTSAALPEPASASAFALAALGLGAARRRKRL
jgi:hypothetical protein